jgi:FMN-dependent NADH-azoreductase
MPSLLHLDSSLAHQGSTSRAVTAAFAEAWRRANPTGHYRYRDLAGASLLPHLDELDRPVPAGQQTPEQAARLALNEQLVAELLAADTVLIGAPMYNFTIPSTLKAWIDRVVSPRLYANPQTGEGPVSRKKVVIATARGGSYAPGSPRAPLDFQEPYLRGLFKLLGVERELHFLHTELTLAPVVPALAQFKPQGEASRARALAEAERLAAA